MEEEQCNKSKIHILIVGLLEFELDLGLRLSSAQYDITDDNLDLRRLTEIVRGYLLDSSMVRYFAGHLMTDTKQAGEMSGDF